MTANHTSRWLLALTAWIVLLVASSAAVAQDLQDAPPPPPPPPGMEQPGMEQPAAPSTDDVPPPAEPSDEAEMQAPHPEHGPLETYPHGYGTEPSVPGDSPKRPPWTQRLLRIGALSLGAASLYSISFPMALGMDVALFGQEFHDQARTFSMLNALIGVGWATTTIWPLGLALDGNGDLLATTLSTAAAGGLAIGAMYLYAGDDPDKLLAQSFTPGVFAFVTAIVVYELTSDPSARAVESGQAPDALFSLVPMRDGAGFAGMLRW